jgi:hypothetical protein
MVHLCIISYIMIILSIRFVISHDWTLLIGVNIKFLGKGSVVYWQGSLFSCSGGMYGVWFRHVPC